MNNKEFSLGEELSPVLIEIEYALIDHEAHVASPPKYSNEGFRAAIRIFMSALLDRMWLLQEKENIDLKDRNEMAFKAGESFRELIKTYTDIDTHKIY